MRISIKMTQMLQRLPNILPYYKRTSVRVITVLDYHIFLNSYTRYQGVAVPSSGSRTIKRLLQYFILLAMTRSSDNLDLA